MTNEQVVRFASNRLQALLGRGKARCGASTGGNVMSDREQIERLRYVLSILIGWLVPKTLREEEAIKLWGYINGTEDTPGRRA